MKFINGLLMKISIIITFFLLACENYISGNETKFIFIAGGFKLYQSKKCLILDRSNSEFS